jgi:putative ABC transport system permease protein
MTARLSAIPEGVAIALDAIRANKLRSALTVLGVVIGVSTVMAMASIVAGIRGQIMNTIEIVGPTTIRVLRYFSSTPINPDAPPREVRIRPELEAAEAEALAALPEIGYSAIWVAVLERLEYQGARTQMTVIYGADDRFMEILGGGIVDGRPFTPTEVRTGSNAVILEVEAAGKVFGRINPLGKTMRVANRPFTVVGLYEKPENIFQPPGQEISALVPYEAARRAFRYDPVNNKIILVKPVAGVSVDRAMDVITVQLRKMRGLRPGEPDTFDLITSEQVLSLFNKLTGVFFLVMIVLSSVALMVGGIGVMAIMLVSVTDRTREIGVRMALGATRREILWQFLVEAATLTLVGGVIGVTVGLLAGQGLKALLRLESAVPVWSAALATSVSVGIGLIFGLLPANRAARLDPVEALRYE